MKRGWWLAGAALALSALVGLSAVRLAPTTAQTGTAGHGDDLAALSGDAFDRAFLQEMTMHHAMAVMMARPVAENAQHEELRALAAAIVAEQMREIALMRGWLRDWYGVELPQMEAMMGAMPPGAMGAGGMHAAGTPQGGMPMHGGQGPMAGGPMAAMHGGAGAMARGRAMGGMHGMMPMMMDLGALPIPRMEAVFMSLMIPHHEEAVAMAKLAAGRAAHPEVVDLAEGIIAAQEAEIELLNRWLRDWYGL